MNHANSHRSFRWVRFAAAVLCAVVLSAGGALAASQTPPGVQVAVEHIIIMPGQGSWFITDVISFDNSGAAVAPVHVSLPEGFTGLQFASGVDQSKAVVGKDGFDYSPGLPAGQTTMVLEYGLPAGGNGNAIRIRKSVDIPVTLLFVLFPKDFGTTTVSGSALVQGGDATIDNQQMSQFWAQDLPAGSVFDATLTFQGSSGASGTASGSGSAPASSTSTQGSSVAMVPGTAIQGIWLVVTVGFGLLLVALALAAIWRHLQAGAQPDREGSLDREKWARLFFWQVDALMHGLVDADTANELHADTPVAGISDEELRTMLGHVDQALRNLGYEKSEGRVRT